MRNHKSGDDWQEAWLKEIDATESYIDKITKNSLNAIKLELQSIKSIKFEEYTIPPQLHDEDPFKFRFMFRAEESKYLGLYRIEILIINFEISLNKEHKVTNVKININLNSSSNHIQTIQPKINSLTSQLKDNLKKGFKLNDGSVQVELNSYHQ